MTAKSSSSAGFSLARIELGAHHDLVSLTRRMRSAGEEFGLSRRAIRGLSAATYEVARHLVVRPGVYAEVRLSDGPSLQVAFRVPMESVDNAVLLRTQVVQFVEGLRAMVDDVQVEEKNQTLSICLRTLFVPAVVPQTVSAAPGAEPGHRAPLDDLTMDELRAQHHELSEHFHELQAELEETNRGVVALYAELEANADELQQAEDRLRLLLDSVQDYAICMLTPEGDVASWNAGAERLFGYGADEIIGRDFALFCGPFERDLGIPAEYLREADERGRYAAETLGVRRGGALFDAQVIVMAVRRGRERELRGFSLVVRDITERKQLEADLRRRADELAAANRAKEDFLATLSHELRTPLNAMLGWTRLLRMGKLDTPVNARALETIERNAHIQEQLIADILDVSRIVTGKLRLELRPIELAPIVQAALDAVRPAAAAKAIHLVEHTDFEGAVLGDPDRLQQVVWNLIANAIKFTPARGRIEIGLARSGPSAVLTVSDSGEGIRPDLLPYVFDRFTQGDSTVTRSHGGLGLGLSIVRHIVELHGGKVQAYSEGQGAGATFTVQLPVRAIKHAVVASVDQSRDQSLSGVKVLVVDDDADAREVVSLALAQCGAKTTAVGSAREAMRILPELMPDVLVSDIGMPGEDGNDFIRRLRSAGARAIAATPAVALTGYADPEDQDRALTAGFQKFVAKPVEVDELAAVVRLLAPGRPS